MSIPEAITFIVNNTKSVVLTNICFMTVLWADVFFLPKNKKQAQCVDRPVAMS